MRAEVDAQAAPACLLIEDDAVLRRLLSRHLSAKGWKVSAAASVADAREACRDRSYQFIVTDSLLPDGSGLEFVADLPASHGSPAVLVMSGDRRADRARVAQRHATAAFLLKPFAMCGLDAALARVDGSTRLGRLQTSAPDSSRCELFRGRYLSDLDGAREHVVARLEALALLSCPVLLRDDTGLHVQAAAQALHDAGLRSANDFVAVDCAAVLDLELVLAESRDAGTLLLERLDALALPAQASLLALLLDGEIEQKEARARLRPKVRIVATLAGDRQELVRTGRLHPELAECLGLLEVRLDAPPGAC